MPQAGELQLTGLYLEAAYLKGLLDKIGIQADILHVGAYKGAGEPFTRTGPSEEARQMMDWLIDDLFEQMVQTIAEGRGLTPADVRGLIDRGPFSAAEALDARLIDEIVAADRFVDSLKERYGEAVRLVRNYAVDKGPELDMSSPWAFFKLIGEMVKKRPERDKNNIAVVYVNGMIVTGQTEPGFWGDGDRVGSTDIRRTLARLAEDDSIQAVVIRVDSPGGSAMASDIIWEAVRELAEVKPVAVSMGNIAASGGYYLAVGAPMLFADPGTLTGSIGVVGGKVVTKGLWDWAGVSFYEVQRGAHADLMNSNRVFDEQQRAMMRRQLERVYAMFKDRVSRSRAERLKRSLEQIAEGRVFTGRQAHELGLVDRLGGLADAVAYVADQAGLKTYNVRYLPEQRGFLDRMIRQMTGQDEEEGGGVDLHAGGHLAEELYDRAAVRQLLEVVRRVDPARARALARAWARVDLLSCEGLLAVMPWEFLFGR